MTRDGATLRRVERPLKTLLLGVLRRIFKPRRIPPLDPDAITRLLVIRQHNQLGDMLCVTPLLRALRERYPRSFIALLTSPVNHEIMLHHSSLNTVINFAKRDFLSNGRLHPVTLWRYLKQLRGYKFDLVLVPATVSTSTTSDFLAYATGARIRMGAGSINGKANASAFFYTHECHLQWPAGTPRHQTLRNLDIAESLYLAPSDHTIDLTLTPEEQASGLARVRDHTEGVRPVVAYHVGAGKVPNRWPAGKFAELINVISRETNAATILVSGPMDEEPVRDVFLRLNVPYYIIEKHHIRVVASCIACVDLLVSNDTGIMHVGAATGVPVLSLFGPTDPAQWAPTGPLHRYIQSSSGNIADIQVGEVANIAREMLRSTGARERVAVKQ